MKCSRNIFPRVAIFRIAVVLFFALLPCLVTPSYANTPVNGQAGTFEAAFSPHGGSLSLVLKTIDNAQKSIHVAAYSFTSKPVATALLAAHNRGVDVRVVADAKSNGGGYTAATFLANEGVPVRLNAYYAIMHNKFMIIDGRDLQTGSFNFTAAAASKNAENVLALRDVPDIADQYEKEWQRLWDEAAPQKKRY